ncbi:hypothetical protein E2320_007575, partial [Naja naja]
MLLPLLPSMKLLWGAGGGCSRAATTFAHKKASSYRRSLGGWVDAPAAAAVHEAALGGLEWGVLQSPTTTFAHKKASSYRRAGGCSCHCHPMGVLQTPPPPCHKKASSYQRSLGGRVDALATAAVREAALGGLEWGVLQSPATTFAHKKASSYQRSLGGRVDALHCRPEAALGGLEVLQSPHHLCPQESKQLPE